MLVEDVPSFQKALMDAVKLAPDMTLDRITTTVAESMSALEGVAPDVLLVDLGLPDGSGIDVIRAAHKAWPGCNIMVFTSFGDETHVFRSLEAGATGYLLKDVRPDKTIQELRNLHEGGSPISPRIARMILNRFNQAGPAQPPPGECCIAGETAVDLSSRESEVLHLITKGLATNEVAKLLSVSPHTVLTYVRRIYAKLEVKSKAEAIYEARKLGLLRE